MDSESKVFYQISTGTKGNGQLLDPHIAGFASLSKTGDFYYVHLMMLPGLTFYLSKNKGPETYTVFSKFVGNEETHRLQNPVGQGRLTPDLKSHLEIRFPLLARPVFMSLFPKA